jgi:hypothetical protein
VAQSNDSLIAQWTKANKGYMASTGRRKLAARLRKRIKRRIRAGTRRIEDYHKSPILPASAGKKPSLLLKLRG